MKLNYVCSLKEKLWYSSIWSKLVFPVVMYGCESWTIKKAEFWGTDAFELWYWRRLLRSSLGCKEIKRVNPKGNQPWIFIGRTHTEAETPIFWPSDAKNWLIGKDPYALTDWRQEEKGMTENEVVGWHHWFNGLKFGQTLGDGEGQGSLACCHPLGLQRVRHDWVTKGLQQPLFLCIRHCPRLWELPLALKRI